MDDKYYYLEYLTKQLEHLEAFETGVRRKDSGIIKSVRQSAHKLRGSGTTYGFPEITAAAAALEKAEEDELPVLLAGLIDTIRTLSASLKAEISKTPAKVTSSSAGNFDKTQPPSPDRKIVVIDDDPDILRIVSLALTMNTKFRVLAFEKPENLIEVLKKEKPEAVILDFMMPDIDGQGIIRLLRNCADTKDIPVVFLTAKNKEADINKLLSLGARGVIIKPFDPMKLAGDVEKLLE